MPKRNTKTEAIVECIPYPLNEDGWHWWCWKCKKNLDKDNCIHRLDIPEKFLRTHHNSLGKKFKVEIKVTEVYMLNLKNLRPKDHVCQAGNRNNMNHNKLNEILGVVSTLVAVGGVILNNRRIIACFWLWLISNSLSGLIHYRTQVWSLLVRDLIFLVLAIEGLIRWSNYL